MMAEMSAQRSEIEGLIKKVRDRNYSVSKLKKGSGNPAQNHAGLCGDH